MPSSSFLMATQGYYNPPGNRITAIHKHTCNVTHLHPANF